VAEEKSFFISFLLGLKLLQVPSIYLERIKKMKNEEETVDREHQISVFPPPHPPLCSVSMLWSEGQGALCCLSGGG